MAEKASLDRPGQEPWNGLIRCGSSNSAFFSDSPALALTDKTADPAHSQLYRRKKLKSWSGRSFALVRGSPTLGLLIRYPGPSSFSLARRADKRIVTVARREKEPAFLQLGRPFKSEFEKAHSRTGRSRTSGRPHSAERLFSRHPNILYPAAGQARPGRALSALVSLLGEKTSLHLHIIVGRDSTVENRVA